MKKEVFIRSNLFVCGFLLVNPVSAAPPSPVINLVVPFQNVFLNPNVQIQATYSFGAFSVLFCFADDQKSQLSINWTNKGNLGAGSLPIFLKTKPNFEGNFIDPNGKIIITNAPNLGVAIVNCVYAI